MNVKFNPKKCRFSKSCVKLHLGVEKCKVRAREVLFWPFMNQDIENLISNCSACLKYKKMNSQETFIKITWETLGLDIFFFRNKNMLLITDYFSKYVKDEKINNITSQSVKVVLESQFARYGIPYIIYTDPGKQLNFLELHSFAKEWNFTLRDSSAKFSQSNGMVE